MTYGMGNDPRSSGGFAGSRSVWSMRSGLFVPMRYRWTRCAGRSATAQQHPRSAPVGRTTSRPSVGGAHGALGRGDHVDQVVSDVIVDTLDAAADRAVAVALDSEEHGRLQAVDGAYRRIVGRGRVVGGRHHQD